MKKRTGTLINRNGTWYVKYIIEGCQFKQKTEASTKGEAEKVKEQFMRSRQTGLDQYEGFLKAELMRITKFRSSDPELAPALGEVWEKFLLSPKRPRAGEGTLSHYKSAWNQLVSGLKKSRAKLSDVTKADATERMEAIYQSGASQGTADKHLIKLTAIFNALLPEGLENPFEGVIARGCDNAPDLSYLPLSLTQVEALRIKARRTRALKMTFAEKTDIEGIFTTLTYTGLRLGDVFGLQCDEVLFDRNILLVRCNKTARKKHGSKSAFAKIGIHPELKKVLVELIGDRDSGPVFEFTSGWSRQRQSNNVQLIFKKASVCKFAETGLGNSRNLYGAGSFRHTMEDRLRAADVPQAVINVILCHADRSMAATYATISDEEVVEAVTNAYPVIG